MVYGVGFSDPMPNIMTQYVDVSLHCVVTIEPGEGIRIEKSLALHP